MPYDAGRLVVGCGNVLFKDDGFGPMVIHAIEDYFKENDLEMPEDTQFIDAGTAQPTSSFPCLMTIGKR